VSFVVERPFETASDVMTGPIMASAIALAAARLRAPERQMKKRSSFN
jgi:hypothetical protein